MKRVNSIRALFEDGTVVDVIVKTCSTGLTRHEAKCQHEHVITKCMDAVKWVPYAGEVSPLKLRVQ